MKYELNEKSVTGVQYISKHCLVCGTDNVLGLHAQFFNLEDGSICALFSAQDEHQSYPGRVHGGMVSAILDETLGRAIQVSEPEAFGVTIELNVKFRQPVPLGEELKVVARLDSNTKRTFGGTAELLLADGSVAAQATAKYLRLDVNDIVDGGLEDSNWVTDERPAPQKIEA
ncbi:MAG: PaaI family thioesterase [Coriobacteriia bacterium]|jgi:uncharacterized protein (TIGR00369 family)|nr:PaaI family thioesterase [Coriobacteriia bacterium]MDR2714593.1 PaaI family thioesterase [Coriobacteriales bacterium]